MLALLLPHGDWEIPGQEDLESKAVLGEEGWVNPGRNWGRVIDKNTVPKEQLQVRATVVKYTVAEPSLGALLALAPV